MRENFRSCDVFTHDIMIVVVTDVAKLIGNMLESGRRTMWKDAHMVNYVCW